MRRRFIRGLTEETPFVVAKDKRDRLRQYTDKTLRAIQDPVRANFANMARDRLLARTVYFLAIERLLHQFYPDYYKEVVAAPDPVGRLAVSYGFSAAHMTSPSRLYEAVLNKITRDKVLCRYVDVPLLTQAKALDGK
jgi:hypothetical protein